MNSIKQLEYHQCRACYDSTNNLELLSSYAETDVDLADAKTYGQLLLEICNINVLEDKPFGQWPQFICFDCSNKLRLANDFIQQTNKIDRFLKAVADLLKTRNGVEFFQIPELDIPLEIKMEKDDDIELVVNEREFQYSPIESELWKDQSTLTNDNSYFNHTFKEYANNEMLENDNECIKEILVPSTTEFINNDLIIKDLNKIHCEKSTDIESKKSNGNGKSLCNQCNKLFSNIWNLRRHVRLIHNSQEQKNYYPSIRRHRKNVHNIKHRKTKIIRNKTAPIAKLSSDKNIGLFSCKKCEKIFSSCQKLARHERFVHVTEEQKIPCNYCKHKSGRTDNLKRHMERAHPKAYLGIQEIKRAPFRCDICNRSYARNHYLLQHQKEVHGQ